MTPSFARNLIGTKLPQFGDELAAKRVARTEAADLGIGPRTLIHPILQALEFVEVCARRARQSGDRREPQRIERRRQWRERDRAERGDAQKRNARRPRGKKHQGRGDRYDDCRRYEIKMMDVGGCDAQEQRGGDAGGAEG